MVIYENVSYSCACTPAELEILKVYTVKDQRVTVLLCGFCHQVISVIQNPVQKVPIDKKILRPEEGF